MDSKKELLSGCQKIFDFSSTDMCYQLVPKSKGGSIQLFNKNRGVVSSTTLSLDKLLGKWLKIKKYFIIAEHQHFCSLLFLQPIWRNPGFGLILYNSDGLCVWELPSSPRLDYRVWSRQNSTFSLERSSSGKHGLHIELSMSMPFVFIELKSKYNSSFDKSELLHMNSNLRQEDIRIYNYYGEPLFSGRLVPTSDPTIHLLVFSEFLQTSKDCAKLVRRFLKNPNNLVWSADCNSILFCDCRESIIITLPKIRGNSQSPGYHNSSGSRDSFEDQVYLDAIKQVIFQNHKS